MRRALAVPLVVAASALAVGGVASAQSGGADPPTIAIERNELRPGDRVLITLTGWQARVVTVSVCGNRAERGAADCNMAASQAVGLATNSPTTRSEVTVAAPPTPCPCLLRAASTTQDEVATVPLALVGVPVAPVAAVGDDALLTASLVVRRSDEGLVTAARSLLAGPTSYDVVVSLRNRSSETITGLSLVASAARGPRDDVVSVDVPAPRAIAAGETWTGIASATLPAPVIGRFVWRLTAAGAGPAIHAETVTRPLPLGFVVCVAVLAGDLVAIGARRFRRRRTREVRPVRPLLEQA